MKPKPKPIRMHPALVASLLNGHKTQTRRIMTATNSVVRAGEFKDLLFNGAEAIADDWLQGRSMWLRARCLVGDYTRTTRVYPVIQPHALLWVREGQAGRRATRKGSRITLGVISVRCERLQSIQDHDAMAEGILWVGEPENPLHPWKVATRSSIAHDWLALQLPRHTREQYLSSNRFREICLRGSPSPRDAFAVLWDWLNGAGAWSENPWVWVYEFRTYQQNVDKLIAESAIAEH